MTADADARTVLVRGDFPFSSAVHTIDLEAAEVDIRRCKADSPNAHAAPNDLAYILYTSGSTGQPKGVAVEHRTILNRLAWMWESYPFEENEVGVMRTSINFVDTFWEMLGSLLRGVPSVVAPEAVTHDPRAFVALLAEHGVSRLWLVPSYLEMLLDECPALGQSLPALRSVWSGGEPLSAELYRRFQQAAPDVALYNVYGSTELWDVAVFDPSLMEPPAETVGIGRPIANTMVFVLDDRRQPVPMGAVGRLHVGGAGLARGYLDADLTRERFVPHPFTEGSRLLDTGDLARFRPDGVLELVGREDQQINLRGFRIEPSEVEAVLDRHPEVRASAVAVRARSERDRRLVAFAVPAGASAPSRALLDHVARHLPAHMVPAAVVWVDELPRTPSGKLDRPRLPAAAGEPERDGQPEPPRTPLERTIAAQFEEVLGVDAVSLHDDFFQDLGGHSLLATRLVSRLRSALESEIPLRTIFERPTVAQLARELGPAPEGDGEEADTQALLAEMEALEPEEIDRLLSTFGDAAEGTP